MAASVGAIVANIYYAQPLLPDIARTFGLSASGIGVLAMLNPAGAGLGQLLFVPLGDIRERRGMITIMILGAAAALALTATARNTSWLMSAAFLVGMTASINHVIIPFAAQLAPPAQRGRAVGTVISGLLIGVLVARTFSGYLGAWLGWRMVFATASVFMLVLAVLLRVSLPKSQPTVKMSWPQLIASAVPLWRGLPVLREAVFTSALMFAVFSGFWTAVVFFVEGPPFYFTQPRRGAAQLDRSRGGFHCSLCGPHRRSARRTLQRAGGYGDHGGVLHGAGLVRRAIRGADRGGDSAGSRDAGVSRDQPDAHLRAGAGSPQPPEHDLHDGDLHLRLAGFVHGYVLVAAFRLAGGVRIFAGPLGDRPLGRLAPGQSPYA
jgi:hypothetical protein